MKSVSAAIVVFAGAILIAAGGFVRPSEPKLFVTAIGLLVGLIGLAAWAKSFLASEPDQQRVDWKQK